MCSCVMYKFNGHIVSPNRACCIKKKIADASYLVMMDSTLFVFLIVSLLTIVPPKMYITISGEVVTERLFTEALKDTNLTCHVEGEGINGHMSWLKGVNSSGLHDTLLTGYAGDKVFCSTLSTTLFPEPGTSFITCSCFNDLFRNLSAGLEVTAFGPINMTVNGRRALTSVTVGSSEDIFIKCEVNGSTPNFTWTWKESRDTSYLPVTEGVTSSGISTVLHMKSFRNKMNLSCVANSGSLAGSVILKRHVMLVKSNAKKLIFLQSWQALGINIIIVTLAIGFASFLIVGYICKKVGKSNVLTTRVDSTSNDDLCSHRLNIVRPNGSSTSFNHAYDEANILKKFQLSSKITSSDLVEYWLSTTEDGQVAIAKFMSEKATIAQLLTFRALAKKLDQLTEHGNIVKLLHTEVNEVQCYLYHEYLGTTSLRHYLLRECRQSIGGDIISHFLRFAINVTDAMIFLNDNKFTHPALMSRKILLTDKGVCKVYDIWQEEIVHQRVSVLLSQEDVSSAWLAPETLLFGQYSKLSDIWSFGVFLWELFSYGETPYRHCSSEEIVTKVRNLDNLIQPSICPGGIYDIMLTTWKITDFERPYFQQIRNKLYQFNEDFHHNLNQQIFQEEFQSSYNCLYNDKTEDNIRPSS